MEVAVELEDDLLFQNLSKQISLLIMDDDDGDETPATRCPSVAFQGFSRAHLLPTAPPVPSSLICYDQQLGCRSRDQSKGTGVFIPRSSSHPRRKHNNKQGAARLSSRHQHDKNTTRSLVTSQPSYTTT